MGVSVGGMGKEDSVGLISFFGTFCGEKIVSMNIQETLTSSNIPQNVANSLDFIKLYPFYREENQKPKTYWTALSLAKSVTNALLSIKEDSPIG